MIEKSKYHELKKNLKLWSKPQIEELCSNMELRPEESKLLLSWYDGESVVKITMDNYESNRAYTTHIKTIFTKIRNYLDFKNNNI